MALKFKMFPKFEEDMRIIQNLGDKPNSDNGLSGEALKEKFDLSGIKIQEYLVATIEQLNQLVSELNNQFEGAGEVLNGGTMLGQLDMNRNPLIGVKDPTEEHHAANRNYVDTEVGAVKDIANSKCSASAKTVTIAGWSNNQKTVNVSGVVSDSNKCHVIVSPSEASRESYNDSVVRCIAQGDGTLTFACDDAPSEELTVHVLILV